MPLSFIACSRFISPLNKSHKIYIYVDLSQSSSIGGQLQRVGLRQGAGIFLCNPEYIKNTLKKLIHRVACPKFGHPDLTWEF